MLALLGMLAPSPGRPAVACDEVLLAMIYGRSKQTLFDRQIEAVSGRLSGMMVATHNGDWTTADAKYLQATRTWLDVYRNYLTAPPESLAAHPDWRNGLKSLSADLGAIRKHLEDRREPQLHEAILALQVRLADTYLLGWKSGAREATKAFLDPLARMRDLLERGGVDPALLVLTVTTARSRFQTLSRLSPAQESEEEVRRILGEIQTIIDGLIRPSHSVRTDERDGLKGQLEALWVRSRRFADRFLTAAGEPPLGPEENLHPGQRGGDPPHADPIRVPRGAPRGS